MYTQLVGESNVAPVTALYRPDVIIPQTHVSTIQFHRMVRPPLE